jgi:hypothetical protein
MKALLAVFWLTFLAVSLNQSSLAQRRDGEVPARRNQSGGLNYAPLPGIYGVVSIDSYSRTVRMRAADGATASVYVGEGVYDLSKLKVGDKVQVDFLQPDAKDNKLSAATIWPVR